MARKEMLQLLQLQKTGMFYLGNDDGSYQYAGSVKHYCHLSVKCP